MGLWKRTLEQLTLQGSVRGAAFAIGLAVFLCGSAAIAQDAISAPAEAGPHALAAALSLPVITSISVCSPTGLGGTGSCPGGTFDTHQIVLAPDGSGNAINKYGMGGISDEHQSIFPPGSLQSNNDYLFFVATSVQGGAGSTGVSVLSGGSGPDKNGQWTLDFARTDGYGSYASGYGTIFVAPTAPNCPTVADGNPAHQDSTFDLTYAAPGSVVADPSSPPGNLLMVYEGTNTCFGIASGSNNGNNFYSSVSIATSRDFGHTWPTYRGSSGFTFVPLPGANKNQGPGATTGVLGASVCMGNDCTTAPPANYGRYPVLSGPVSISTAMALGTSLPSSMGDSEMSGFLDDAAANPAQYIYAIYNYKPGTGVLADPEASITGLRIARAQLNGGTAPLSFLKWNGQAFSSAGMGSYDAPILPAGSFSNCEGPGQISYGSSISYVDATQQYLLTFVCDTPGDPALPQVAGAARGGAWFYSTSYSLEDPTQWTPPQEITGSWAPFDQSGGCSSYKGFYPTLMSLGAKTGHLSATGNIFYLWGCQTDNTPPPGRQYSSRAFTMTLGSSPTAGTMTSTLPHVADGNGFDTLVLLINTGTTDATYSLQFLNQSGAPVNYPLDPAQSGMSGVVHAGSQAIVRTAGSGSSTHLGWGQLTAPASVKGMLIYQQQASATSLQEGSVPIAPPNQHFFFPFDDSGTSTTSIGFANPSATQTATVNFTVLYDSGGTDAVPALKMNALQQIALPLTGIWANTAGKRGMIEVDANTDIGLVAFRFQGSAFTLVDTIADTAGGTTSVTSTIAHSADGNNFKSTFILTNSGTVAAPYTLSILNATGQAQTFGFDVAGPLSGTVPAGSTLTIDTTGLGSVTNLGWAQLSAAPAVSGIEVFRQTNPGKSEQQATIPISQSNSSHFLLPFDNASNTTSIALANPDPAVTATINVTFRYVDGTSNVGRLTLPPRNYEANLLASLFTATTGKAGVAEFTSNVPIAVVEVRFNPTQAFTSLRSVSP